MIMLNNKDVLAGDSLIAFELKTSCVLTRVRVQVGLQPTKEAASFSKPRRKPKGFSSRLDRQNARVHVAVTRGVQLA